MNRYLVHPGRKVDLPDFDPADTSLLPGGDWEERKLGKDYTRAYEGVLSKTSTDWAPWYIVPANQYPKCDLSDVLVE